MIKGKGYLSQSGQKGGEELGTAKTGVLGKNVTYLKGIKGVIKSILRNMTYLFKHKNRINVCPRHKHHVRTCIQI